MSAEVLPWLPQGWLDGIAAGDYVERARGEVGSTKKAWSWIRKRPEAKGEPCSVMQGALDLGLQNLDFGGSAHDELTARTYQLISLGAEGHRGAHTALFAFGRRFVATVSGERRAAALDGRETGTIRGEDEARREVGRAVLGAVKLMLGHLQQPEMVEAGMANGAGACSCWEEPEIVGADGERVAGSSGKAKDPFEYELTETGNAQHLADLVDGNLLWISAEKSWFAYDPTRHTWRGEEHVGTVWAMRIAPRVKAAAEQRFRAAEGLDQDKNPSSAYSDADLAAVQGKKLWVWADRCGSAANVNNTLNMAKALPGMHASMEQFDADGQMLSVGGGEVLEFTDDRLVVRKAEREDFLTKTTGTPYVPGATDSLWSNYLETFIPDAQLRDFVQRLFGYGLIGGNPRRHFVFLHGPTSTGKSTFVEAVGAAVGDYGGPIGMSVFRDNQDDKPRPDLLAALGLRFAFSSEAGAEQHLHNDQIKRLTGGDTIPARNMQAKQMQYQQPQFLPMIATNDPPHIKNADAALWRRMLTVPFDVQAMGDGDDPLARERLKASPAARAAVLAWLVAGWEGYRERGLSDVPQIMLERAHELKGGVSEFHGWFYDRVENKEGAWIWSSDLYEAYRVDMQTEGVKDILTSKQFGTAVGRELGAKALQKRNKENVNTRYRPGIRLRR